VWGSGVERAYICTGTSTMEMAIITITRPISVLCGNASHTNLVLSSSSGIKLFCSDRS